MRALLGFGLSSDRELSWSNHAKHSCASVPAASATIDHKEHGCSGPRQYPLMVPKRRAEKTSS
jgi:hypothetical protein